MKNERTYPVAKVNPLKDLIIVDRSHNGSPRRYEMRNTMDGFHGVVQPTTSAEKTMLEGMSVERDVYRTFRRIRELPVAPQIMQNREFYTFSEGGAVNHYLPKSQNSLEDVKSHPHYYDEAAISEKSLPWAVRMTNATDTVTSPWVEYPSVKELVERTVTDHGDLLEIGKNIDSSMYGLVIDLNERGQFHASVHDVQDKIKYAINSDGGTPLSIIEDGYMSNIDDVEGLRDYLVEINQLSIMPDGHKPTIHAESDWYQQVEAAQLIDCEAVITNKGNHIEMEFAHESFAYLHEGDPLKAQVALWHLEGIAMDLNCGTVEYENESKLNLIFETERPAEQAQVAPVASGMSN